ncbi:MAG: hypothetical protein Q607_CBUC00214G0054 [Clostridium butyricum DORA_1]|nr:MAG: hypothetical protein Q607_CBUC00214G0054 [Clostridium butyricum DORA_1]
MKYFLIEGIVTHPERMTEKNNARASGLYRHFNERG